MLFCKRSCLAVLAAASMTACGPGSGLPTMDFVTDMGIDRLWLEPREVLVDRVEGARDAQQATMEEFQSAMEQFKSVTGFDGGELEAQYDKLNDAFLRSAAHAEQIGSRIDKVTAAANTLLDEWRGELDDYHDAKLRRVAERQFDETRVQAEKLIASMRAVEQRTEPVLALFRDQVLYLKHNLNARAINSLDQERSKIQRDVEVLVADMRVAIDEANAFIDSLRT